MVLHSIWCAFFGVAFLVGLIKLVFLGDLEIFGELVQSTFSSAKLGFELALGLTGVMTLWLGLMRIGEQGGMVRVMSGLVSPFFR